MIMQRLLTLTAVIALASPALAQSPELTLERIYASRDFTPSRVDLKWAADGEHYTVVEEPAPGRTDMYRIDVRSGRRELLVRGSSLVPDGEARAIEIDDYAFSDDGNKVLILTNERRIWRHSTVGEYYVWDLVARTLTPVSAREGGQRYAKLSPDGSKVAFVRDNNIYMTDLVSGAETALTTDGDEDIINGAADWVYEEELVLFDGFRWSPDGESIAFWRFDQSAIKPFYLVNELNLYPELVPIRYPKAGTTNSTVQIGVVEVGGGETRWIDTGVDPDGYIARMDFAHSSGELWIQTLNRHQNRMDLKLADVASGRSRTVMTDDDAAWVDLTEPHWISDGRRFLYLSERDGYSHIYLYERNGELVGQLTQGRWDVAAIEGVDVTGGFVYFTGSADGPMARPLYRVGLDGTGFVRSTELPVGRSSADFSPGGAYYVETYSQAGVPPVQTLREADGSVVRVLADNSEMKERLGALGLNAPEFITIPVDDGIDLNAWIIKPSDFDPAQRYPLLMYVYGGPGSQTVTDNWGRDRYLWHQMLAGRGFIVASVDNRGTGARGVAFKKITYQNLGHYETTDQIAAARHLGALPYVDESRIGIWGWSYGGYMAALSLFKGADVFKAGISVAPVSDWRLYDTIYTERYMRTPQENPDGYAESGPLAYADQLQGKFLLVHGTGDDNVHPQNSTLLVERLIEANKQFDYRLYPNRAHSIAGPVSRVNLFAMMTEFLVENL